MWNSLWGQERLEKRREGGGGCGKHPYRESRENIFLVGVQDVVICVSQRIAVRDGQCSGLAAAVRVYLVLCFRIEGLEKLALLVRRASYSWRYVNQAHLIQKKKGRTSVSPRTINCFSAKSLPFEALFSIGTHIAFFSPSLLPGLPRAFVPVKPTPLSKVDGRDWVPVMAQIETPRDCKYAIALQSRQDKRF